MRGRLTIRSLLVNKYHMKDFGVYVWTSDRQMVCLPAWAYLFNKFWPYEQNVKILGYKKPSFALPKNFDFVSLGEQRGPKYWSNDMKNYFKTVDKELIYLTCDDGFIVDNVNKDLLDMALKVSFLNPNDKFLKFNLTCDVSTRAYETLKQFENYNLIRSLQHVSYRQSLNHAIWNKDRFLSKLIDGYSPWDFELDIKNSVNDGYDIYATNGLYTIHCGHGYKRGKKIMFSQLFRKKEEKSDADALLDFADSSTDDKMPDPFHITEAAAKKIKSLVSEEKSATGLRIFVQGGGCSGYTHSYEFTQNPEKTDKVFVTVSV